MSFVASRGALLLAAALTVQLPLFGQCVLLTSVRNGPSQEAAAAAKKELRATRTKQSPEPVEAPAASATNDRLTRSPPSGSVAPDAAWCWQTLESFGEPKARVDSFRRDVFNSFDAFAAQAAAADEIARAQEFLALPKFGAKAAPGTAEEDGGLSPAAAERAAQKEAAQAASAAAAADKAGGLSPAAAERAAQKEAAQAASAAAAADKAGGLSPAAADRAAQKAAAQAALPAAAADKAAAAVAPKAVAPTSKAEQRAATKAAKAAAKAAAEKAAPPSQVMDARASEVLTDAEKMAAEIIAQQQNQNSDAQRIAAEIMEQERARWRDIQSQEVTLQRDLAGINQTLQQVTQALANLNVPQMLVSVAPVMDAIEKSLKQGEAVVSAYSFMSGPNNEAVSSWFTGLSTKMTATMKQFDESTSAAAAKSGNDIAAITYQIVQAGEWALRAYQTSRDIVDEVQAKRGVAAEMLALQLHIPSPSSAGAVGDKHEDQNANKANKAHKKDKKEDARSHLLKRAGNAEFFTASAMREMKLDQAFFKKGSESDCDKAKNSVLSAKASLADFEKKIGSVSASLPMLLSPLVQAATNAAASVNSQLLPLLDVPFLNNPSSAALSSAMRSSFAALADFPAQLNATVQTAAATAVAALKDTLPQLPPVFEVSNQMVSSLDATCSVDASALMATQV